MPWAGSDHLWCKKPLLGCGPGPLLLDEPSRNEEALTDAEKSLPLPPAFQLVQIEVGWRAASQGGTGTWWDTVCACAGTCVIAGEGRRKSFLKPLLSDQEGTGEKGKGRGSAEQVQGGPRMRKKPGNLCLDWGQAQGHPLG